MALTTCTHCEQRISSKYSTCPHCGQPVGDAQPAMGGDDKPAPPARRKLRRRVQDLSHLALLAMVAGSIWYYVDSGGLKQPAGAGPVWLMAAGASLYLYLRIWWLLRRIRRGQAAENK